MAIMAINEGAYPGRRQILAVCMESPLYFTMTLKKRFDFIKDLEQRTYWSNVGDLASAVNVGGEK
jgi:hypothetical protein